MDLLVCRQLEFDFGTKQVGISQELQDASTRVCQYVNSGSQGSLHPDAHEVTIEEVAENQQQLKLSLT